MPYLFTEDPEAIGAEIEKVSGALLRDVMIRMWDNLAKSPAEGGTPRDTEFASASWILSIGVASDEVAGSKDQVDHSIAGRAVNALESYKLSWGAIFLVNNTEYIIPLNYGWSPQASPGFVERAQDEAILWGSRVGDL